MSESHSVRVMIGGQELVVSSDHPPEYTRRVAAHFDEALKRIRTALPAVDAQRAAILAGLAVTDELFQAQDAAAVASETVAAVNERLGRLLPPAKRTRGSDSTNRGT